MKVDFPFKVTDLEHAIINLRSKPPCSLLLLGRSGTGKTTCCLYRMWASFITYWEHANQAENEPLLPRTITFLQDKAENNSKEEVDEETAAAAGLSMEDIIAKKLKEEQEVRQQIECLLN